MRVRQRDRAPGCQNLRWRGRAGHRAGVAVWGYDNGSLAGAG
ncbi:hypothetical protein [Halomicronema sp. CCY15110]|nr:hypothetical protein [Halomicronema sp. CCY15110]